jgi:hypothetical protein
MIGIVVTKAIFSRSDRNDAVVGSRPAPNPGREMKEQARELLLGAAAPFAPTNPAAVVGKRASWSKPPFTAGSAQSTIPGLSVDSKLMEAPPQVPALIRNELASTFSTVVPSSRQYCSFEGFSCFGEGFRWPGECFNCGVAVVVPPESLRVSMPLPLPPAWSPLSPSWPPLSPWWPTVAASLIPNPAPSPVCTVYLLPIFTQPAYSGGDAIGEAALVGSGCAVSVGEPHSPTIGHPSAPHHTRSTKAFRGVDRESTWRDWWYLIVCFDTLRWR